MIIFTTSFHLIIYFVDLTLITRYNSLGESHIHKRNRLNTNKFIHTTCEWVTIAAKLHVNKSIIDR